MHEQSNSEILLFSLLCPSLCLSCLYLWLSQVCGSNPKPFICWASALALTYTFNALKYALDMVISIQKLKGWETTIHADRNQKSKSCCTYITQNGLPVKYGKNEERISLYNDKRVTHQEVTMVVICMHPTLEHLNICSKY